MRRLRTTKASNPRSARSARGRGLLWLVKEQPLAAPSSLEPPATATTSIPNDWPEGSMPSLTINDPTLLPASLAEGVPVIVRFRCLNQSTLARMEIRELQ